MKFQKYIFLTITIVLFSISTFKLFPADNRTSIIAGYNVYPLHAFKICGDITVGIKNEYHRNNSVFLISQIRTGFSWFNWPYRDISGYDPVSWDYSGQIRDPSIPVHKGIMLDLSGYGAINLFTDGTKHIDLGLGLGIIGRYYFYDASDNLSDPNSTYPSLNIFIKALLSCDLTDRIGFNADVGVSIFRIAIASISINYNLQP